MNDIILDCYIKQITSKKGNLLKFLVIEFANGYTYEQFLSNEQQFCLSDVVPIK